MVHDEDRGRRRYDRPSRQDWDDQYAGRSSDPGWRDQRPQGWREHGGYADDPRRGYARDDRMEDTGGYPDVYRGRGREAYGAGRGWHPPEFEPLYGARGHDGWRARPMIDDDWERLNWGGQSWHGDPGHGGSGREGGGDHRRADQAFDPEYRQWRDEQLRTFDDDYRSWRQDRYQKFSDEFSQWRNQRSGTEERTGQAAGTGSEGGTRRSGGTQTGSGSKDGR